MQGSLLSAWAASAGKASTIARRSCSTHRVGDNTPVRLVLAGVDPASLVGHAAGRVPSRHTVVCLPFVSDVRPLYDLLELVLLPSRIEGLSQALLEAMALGKPVIASAAAGNLDLVATEVSGLLVPPLAPREWAAAIDRVLQDQPLALRARRCRPSDRLGSVLASIEPSSEPDGSMSPSWANPRLPRPRASSEIGSPISSGWERERGQGFGLHHRQEREQAGLSDRGQHPLDPARVRRGRRQRRALGGRHARAREID